MLSTMNDDSRSTTTNKPAIAHIYNEGKTPVDTSDQMPSYCPFVLPESESCRLTGFKNLENDVRFVITTTTAAAQKIARKLSATGGSCVSVRVGLLSSLC